MARVFIITQDEPVYAPAYVAQIIQKIRHEVVGITALSPGAGVGWLTLVRRRLDMYGPVDLVRALSLYGRCRIRGFFKTDDGRLYSVRQVAERHGVAVFPSSDINAPEYVATLRVLHLDLIVSVSANQLFRGPLLSLPRLGCLNVHSALLPRYRGIDGLFWALAHGEREVGVTVHRMNERLDAGDIVAQKPFSVGADDSLHDVFIRAINVGSSLLARAIDDLAAGTAIIKPNDITSGSYFSWPTRTAAREFRKHGRRFF